MKNPKPDKTHIAMIVRPFDLEAERTRGGYADESARYPWYVRDLCDCGDASSITVYSDGQPSRCGRVLRRSWSEGENHYPASSRLDALYILGDILRLEYSLALTRHAHKQQAGEGDEWVLAEETSVADFLARLARWRGVTRCTFYVPTYADGYRLRWYAATVRVSPTMRHLPARALLRLLPEA